MEAEGNKKKTTFEQLTAIHSDIIGKNNSPKEQFLLKDQENILFSPRFMSGRQDQNLQSSELLLWLTVWRTGFELCDQFGTIPEWKLKHLFNALRSYLVSPDKYVVYETQRVFVAVLKKLRLQFVMEEIGSGLRTTSKETLGTVYSYAEICRDLLSRHNPHALPFFDHINQSLFSFVTNLFENRSHAKFYDCLYQLILIQIKTVKLIILYQHENASKFIIKILNNYGTKLVDILFDCFIQGGFIWKKACQMWFRILSLLDVSGFESRKGILRRFALCMVEKMFQFGVFLMFPSDVTMETERQLTLGFIGSTPTGAKGRSSDSVWLTEGCLLTMKACECLIVKPGDGSEAKLSVKKSYTVLCNLHTFVDETLSCDSKVFFHWLPLLFGEQDDSWIEALLMLLNIASKGQLPDLDRPVYVKHHHYFHQFIAATGYDHSMLVDLLTSPETCFLAYFTKYLKYCLAAWTDFVEELRVCPETHELTRSYTGRELKEDPTSTEMKDECGNETLDEDKKACSKVCNSQLDTEVNKHAAAEVITPSTNTCEKRRMPFLESASEAKKLKSCPSEPNTDFHTIKEVNLKPSCEINTVKACTGDIIEEKCHKDESNEHFPENTDLQETLKVDKETKCNEPIKANSQTGQESVLVTEHKDSDSVNCQKSDCQMSCDIKTTKLTDSLENREELKKEPDLYLNKTDNGSSESSFMTECCAKEVINTEAGNSKIEKCNKQIKSGSDRLVLDKANEDISFELDAVEFIEEPKSKETLKLEHAQSKGGSDLVVDGLESLDYENVASEHSIEVCMTAEKINVAISEEVCQTNQILGNLDGTDDDFSVKRLSKNGVAIGLKNKEKFKNKEIISKSTECGKDEKLVRPKIEPFGNNSLSHSDSSEIITSAEIDLELESIEFHETSSEDRIEFKLVDYELDESENFSDSENNIAATGNPATGDVGITDRSESDTEEYEYEFEEMPGNTANQDDLVDYVLSDEDEKLILNGLNCEADMLITSEESLCRQDSESGELTETDRTNETLDKVMGVLIRVRMKLEKLKTASMLQYNPGPLLKLLNSVEEKYESL